MTGTLAEQSFSAAPGWLCDCSLELIRECALKPEDPIVDVSGGASLLERLLAAGYRDITILEPSIHALEALRRSSGEYADCVTLVSVSAIEYRSRRRYALWHDAGVFQRLLHAEERQQYVETVQQTLRAEGHLVLMTGGPDAPAEGAGRRIRRYSVQTLPAELGSQFELTRHGLAREQASGAAGQELLHCRFVRHAPRWPH